MKRIVCLFLVLGSVFAARADTMTLSNGEKIDGNFLGFSARKFSFKSQAGVTLSEYPVNVKAITLTSPLKVSLVLMNSQHEDVDFYAFEEYTLRLAKDGETLDQRVILLKSMTVVAPPPPAPEEEVNRKEARSPEEIREWQRSGKWREIEARNTRIISKGEEVDIERRVRKGFINIVHFHNPKLLPSIREGNYVEALAANSSKRIVILKIVVEDFNAPVCVAQDITSLPQFWFYDERGNLVHKLTKRFTEGDIDRAVTQARRGER
jgi:hypothetical protein